MEEGKAKDDAVEAEEAENAEEKDDTPARNFGDNSPFQNSNCSATGEA